MGGVKHRLHQGLARRFDEDVRCGRVAGAGVCDRETRDDAVGADDGHCVGLVHGQGSPNPASVDADEGWIVRIVVRAPIDHVDRDH